MTAVLLAVRFALELCALAALGYAGWQAPVPLWARVLVAAGLPIAAALVWGRWVAPKASHRLPDPLRLLAAWVVFGGATVALLAVGRPVLAAVFAALAVGHRFALRRLGADTG
jgi:Protein of unknown function (DUF2568)